MLSMRQFRRDDHEREQRAWAHDIDMYYKWKNLRDREYAPDTLKQACQNRMDDIKARWPNHAKHFN